MNDRLKFASLAVASLLLTPFVDYAISSVLPESFGILVALALFTFYYVFLIQLGTHILSEIKGPIWQLIPGTLLISFLMCYVLAFIPWSWRLLPDVAKDFDGYITNLYFTVATFTSVGYGDFTPKDSWGRIFAIAISLLGAAHSIGFLTILLLKAQHGKALQLEELPEKSGGE
jgi:Ion channel